MRIIDRYLLRQLLQAFLICLLSLTGLWIVVDTFGNLEEFLRHGEKQGSLLAVLAEYYGYRTLSFFDRTSGILALVAAMFTMTWFQRYNELTALMAAGVSKARIVRPVIVAVIAVSVLAMINRELVIPQVRERFSRNAQDLGGDAAKALQPRYDHKTDVLLAGKKTLAASQTVVEPNFLLPRLLDEYGQHLAAAEARYLSPAEGRPGGYLLVGVTQPKALDERPSLSLRDQAIIITPRDAEWLEPGQCFLVSEVTFEQLVGGTSWKQFSSTMELIRGLRNPSLGIGADVRVAIHARLVQPLLDITLLFLGLPLVITRENRNVFAAIGLCFAVVLAFMLVVLACHYLGSSYLISPALAAWCPLMIFVPIAVGMSEPLRA